MSKKKDEVDDKVEDVVKVKEDIFEEEEIEEDRNRSSFYNYKNKIWMIDISDEFFDLKDYYSKIDDRLKWVNMSDILYAPRSCYSIKYDEHINEYIDQFMDLLDSLLDRMKRKKLQIIEDDEMDFNRLVALNKQKIYSRIAFCLEKWFIN